MDDDQFFASLNAGIDAITQKSNLQSARDKLLSKLSPAKRRSMDESAISAAKYDLAEVNRQLEAIQWRNEATVALFSIQLCENCGAEHRIFLQHMHRQSATSGPKVKRWVRAKVPLADLPREVVNQLTHSTCCYDCIGEFGFEPDKAEIKFAGHSEPFSIPVETLDQGIIP